MTVPTSMTEAFAAMHAAATTGTVADVARASSAVLERITALPTHLLAQEMVEAITTHPEHLDDGVLATAAYHALTTTLGWCTDQLAHPDPDVPLPPLEIQRLRVRAEQGQALARQRMLDAGVPPPPA